MLPFEILLTGIPVTSSRGALGWCTVAHLALEGKHIIFDTGSYGDRHVLLERLDKAGIFQQQIDTIVISHLHYDHFVNVEIFPRANILVSKRDLEYVLSGEYIQANDPNVPIGLIRQCKDRITIVEDGEFIVPGLRVMELPGHTPGTIGLYCEKDKILFASDAVKNAWEFQHNKPSTFFSKALALENYARIRKIAHIIVPGHDRQFTLGPDNSIQYADHYRAELCTYVDPENEAEIYTI